MKEIEKIKNRKANDEVGSNGLMAPLTSKGTRFKSQCEQNFFKHISTFLNFLISFVQI